MKDVWTPPEAPVADAAPPPTPDAAIIRRRDANHEASIKSMAWVYLYITFISGLPMLLQMLHVRQTAAYYAGLALVTVVINGGIAWTAYSIGQLKPWARIVMGALAAWQMLGFPAGTVFGAYFLYLLFSPRGNIVFSQAYRDAVAQTPEIEGRVSNVVPLFLVLYFVLGILGSMGLLHDAD